MSRDSETRTSLAARRASNAFRTALDDGARALSTPALVLPTIGIVVSEGLLFTGHTYYSLGAHLLTLFVCTVAPLRFGENTELFQVFALIPLFRLVNLGMPVFFELTLAWYPLIYGPLVPAAYFLVRDRAFVRIDGWRQALIWLPLAVPLSAFLGIVEYSIIRPAALIPSLTPLNVLFLGAVMLFFVGFVEELLYRALLQRSLVGYIGTWPAILLASALFGLMHSAYAEPLEVVFAAAIGLLYGVIYNRTSNLMLVTILHGLLNVFLFGVVPFHADAIPFLGG